jgi:hypothetical protein
LLPETDVTTIDEIFEELGPTARLCIEYASDPEQLQGCYKAQLDVAISNIMAGELEELIQKSTQLAMDAVSHKICLISRRDPKNIVSPIYHGFYQVATLESAPEPTTSRTDPPFQTIGEGAWREGDSRHCL